MKAPPESKSDSLDSIWPLGLPEVAAAHQIDSTGRKTALAAKYAARASGRSMKSARPHQMVVASPPIRREGAGMLRGFWVAFVALALMAGGCATQVETNITAFHTLQNGGRGQTFVMIPYEDQEGSLEWRTYAGLVSQQLVAKGLVTVERIADADLAVFMAYAIDRGRTTVSTVPMYGQTGGGTTSTTTGYVGSRPVYASTYTPPTYGVTGYVPVEDTVYGRALKIIIIDAKRSFAEKKPVPVYEATATSTGSSGTLNVVMPSIVNGVFKDWPGPSGVTQKQATPLRE